MTTFTPAKPYRYGKRNRPPTPQTPAPPALVLTAASLEIGPALSLTFDRAIDISQIVPGAFFVDDGDGIGQRYTGDTASLDSPTNLIIDLITTGDPADPGVHLTAGPNTGVTATDNTGTWPGADDLALPFP